MRIIGFLLVAAAAGVGRVGEIVGPHHEITNTNTNIRTYYYYYYGTYEHTNTTEHTRTI